MSQDLSAVVDWETLCGPKSFVLVTETGHSDANFLLSYALARHLMHGKNKAVGCMVTLMHTMKHYRNVSLKLCVNLQRATDQGQLAMIDGLKITRDSLKAQTDDVGNGEKQPSTNAFHAHRDGLKSLYDQIRSAVEKMVGNSPRKKCLLIVDNVSFLLHVGLRVSDVLGFVEHCRHFMVSVGGCMVALTYAERPEEEADEEQAQLWRLLAHRSDAILNVADLASGYCRDVHGELTVQYRSRSPDQPVLNTLKRWHFKLEEKRVMVFAPGMSSALL